MNVLLRIKHLEKQPQKIVIPFFFEKFGQKNFSVCLLFLNKNTAFWKQGNTLGTFVLGQNTHMQVVYSWIW